MWVYGFTALRVENVSWLAFYLFPGISVDFYLGPWLLPLKIFSLATSTLEVEQHFPTLILHTDME